MQSWVDALEEEEPRDLIDTSTTTLVFENLTAHQDHIISQHDPRTMFRATDRLRCPLCGQSKTLGEVLTWVFTHALRDVRALVCLPCSQAHHADIR